MHQRATQWTGKRCTQFYDLVMGDRDKLPYLARMGRAPVSWFFKDPISQTWLPVTMIKRSRESIAANAMFDERTAREYMDRTEPSRKRWRMHFTDEGNTVDMLIHLAAMQPDRQTIVDVCREIVERWDPGVIVHRTMSVVSTGILTNPKPFSPNQGHIMASTHKLPLRKRPRLSPSCPATPTAAVKQGLQSMHPLSGNEADALDGSSVPALSVTPDLDRHPITHRMPASSASW